MAWDGVQFRDEKGNPVTEKTRDTILSFVEKALGTPDADPDVLLNAASAVCANIRSIRNFPAYANRSIFRIARKAYIAERKLTAKFHALPDEAKSIEDRAVSHEVVEQQILLQELMLTLGPLDKEIYTHRLNGLSFVEIDEALSLKPRTSEYRFREAQFRLRKSLSAPPPR